MSNLRDTSHVSTKKINPILHSASLIGADLASTTLLPPEPKSLVTVSYGDTSTSDLENLDEINLNPVPENLDPPAIIDTNSNSLLAQDIQNDSLLSQAASSFSALPSVASSVLSTFSKRIYAGNSREQTPAPTQDISNNPNFVSDSENKEPTTNPYINQQIQFQSNNQQQEITTPTQGNLNFLQNTTYENSVPEPPKLYSPTEIPASSAIASALPPPSAAGGAQNSYRLAAKKKLYAPIPGLSGQATVTPTAFTPAPISTVPGVAEHFPQESWTQQASASSQQEQQKSGGLFSLSNLVPSGVLQNISDIVQTATGGSLSTSVKSETTPAVYISEPPKVVSPYYPTTEPPSKFFAATAPPSVPPANISTPFNPFPTSQPIANVQTAERIENAVPLFPPSPLPYNSTTTATAAVSLTAVTSTLQSAPSSHPLVPTPPQNPNSSATNVNFFNPSAPPATAPLQPYATPQIQDATPLAPPPASGQVSFRLQKGTRLYKNPLNSAEIAPNYVSPQPTQLQPPTVHQTTPQQFFAPQATAVGQSLQTSFNPFGQPLDIASAPPQAKNTTPNVEPSLQQAPSTLTTFDAFNTAASQPFVQPLAQAFDNIQLYAPQTETAFVKPELSSPFIEPTQNQISSVEQALQQPPTAEITKSETQALDQGFFANASDAPAGLVNTSLSPEKQTESLAEITAPKTDSSLQQLNTTPLSKEPEVILPSQEATDITTSSTLNQAEASEASVDKASAVLPPPPLTSATNPFAQKPLSNPYRKSSCDTVTGLEKAPLPTLASFFTPTVTNADNLGDNFDLTAPRPSSSSSASFFGEISDTQPKTEKIFPQASNFFNTAQSNDQVTVASAQFNIPPPIGFETFATQINQTTASAPTESQTTEVVADFFTNEKNKPDFQQAATKNFVGVNNFFDAFNNSTPAAPVLTPSVPVGIAPGTELNDDTNSKEEQIIQNFFNNPPPKENSSGVGDLNYDLVHSGLGVRAQHTGSLTTASNVVEPPSSICSEISEINNFASNQRLLPPQGVEAVDAKAEVKPQHDAKSDIDNIGEHYKDLPEAILLELRKMANEKAATAAPASTAYTPAVKHWFYKRFVGQKHIWTPFSHYDSALIETSLTSHQASPIVSVEGGRYDVNIADRIKTPVYWEGEPIEVRRCSWFYKASDSKYVPYDEDISDRLEEEYRQAAESGVWHKKIIIAQNDHVVFHGPTVIVHFQQQQNVDAWGGTSQTTSRPRVVKRDLDDFTIEMGESSRADHLLLMVHGIGSACDLKLRTVEEVVDDFRSIAQQLVQSHYKNSIDMGIVGRVEVLPISWHSHLHSEEMGIDEKLKSITLESIPKLRNFTNDTLLDVLFYTSPTYCQKIVNTVASEMNTIYLKYRQRHPDFSGGVSLAGHSLGSLILFDLLCHQQPIKESEEQNMENPNQPFTANQFPLGIQPSYTMGPAGTGQPSIQYGQLVFHPKKFFALGSPIGMFVTIRGIDKLGLDFRLPTCPGFYNIFHPFDPVAYRIEALVNPDMSGIRPVLIPHHKGRKRMHLELKETMTRVGADLKARFLDTFKNTLESVNFMGTTRSKKEAQESMEKDVDEVIAMQIDMDRENAQTNESAATMTDVSHASSEIPATSSARSRANSNSTNQSDTDIVEIDFPLGKLNDAKRVDYVLQEAPLEFFNEYLFALSSHVCYWDSSDTILFVMKEIYSGLGISPDSQIPQQTMTIERPNSRNSVSQSILPPTL